MNRKRKKEIENAPVRIGLSFFPHPWEHDASSARAAVRKRKRERQDEEKDIEGKMYPYQRWNEIRMPRRGCMRENDRCLPQKPLSATYWIRRASLASTPPCTARREKERERAMRATRCKTLPVNFIALGTSSYTSTCTTRHLTYLHSTRNRRDHHHHHHHHDYHPLPRLLIRSGVNLTTGTFRRTCTHTFEPRDTGTYIVVIACVHTGRAAARVFTTDGG